MPNFKQGGKGFQMKGFSAFMKKDAPMKKPLVGDQDKLPMELKEKIKKSPMEMGYKKSPMYKYKK